MTKSTGILLFPLADNLPEKIRPASYGNTTSVSTAETGRRITPDPGGSCAKEGDGRSSDLFPFRKPSRAKAQWPNSFRKENGTYSSGNCYRFARYSLLAGHDVRNRYRNKDTH